MAILSNTHGHNIDYSKIAKNHCEIAEQRSCVKMTWEPNGEEGVINE